MILGIGTDMVEVLRIEKACEGRRFLERIYTKAEQTICEEKSQRLAGNFAVKEAVVKVFGTGFRGIEPNEIEVLRDNRGKPYVILYGKAKEKQQELGITNLQVSITNTKEYTMAFVIGEGEEK